MNSLEKKKLKLDEEKQKLLLREKILKEQEKKKRAKQFIEVGRLAYKANIDQLDPHILLGAFLEIAQNKNERQIEKWKQNSESFINEQGETNSVPLTIKFKTEPDQSIINQLSELKFKWNRFLKIYYGKGNRKNIESLLNNCNYQMEEVND
jgi:hypothetical protein